MNIQSIISNHEQTPKSYLQYVAQLAQELKAAVTLRTRVPAMHLAPMASHSYSDPISSMPVGNVLQEKVNNHVEEHMKRHMETIKQSYSKVDYKINYGEILSHVEDIEDQTDTLLWIQSLNSTDSFTNQFFGTRETELSKLTESPCLNVPQGLKYKKPKSLTCFIRGIDQSITKKLFEIKNRLGFHINYVFEGSEDHALSIRKALSNMDMNMDDLDGTIKILDNELDGGFFADYLPKLQSDWIAFVGFETDFFGRLMSVSTNELILKTNRPTLIL